MATTLEAPPIAGDAPARPSPGPRRLRHVAALDGLRGVAVLAVVLYHLDGNLLPGGFLGVSLFFTLSGFLITNLLLAEWEGSRRVGLGAFWSRRFRRLLPAALLGLIVATVTAWWWADAHQLADLRGDVLGALAYVANWRFVFHGDAYGAGFQAPSPVLHYWSLAIEEQFYIVVAIIAVVLARVARHRRAWFVTFAVLAALSMLATVRLWSSTDTNRVYFGSDTRAFELLAGVLLAIVIRFEFPARLARRPIRHLVPIVVAVGMLTAMARAGVNQRWLYHGGLWIVALGSVVLILGALDRGPIAAGLSWKPLAALGLISYGVYLYHWPLFVFLTSQRTGLDGLALVALRLGATLALALASYWLIEQPIRQRRWGWRPGTIVAAVAVVVTMLLLVSTVLLHASTTRDIVATPDVQLSNTDLTSASPDASSSPAPVAAPPLQRVLFLGDSLVHQSFPTLAARFAAVGVQVQAIGGDGQHLLWNGEAWRQALDSAMADFEPQVVVLEACCGWGTPWRPEQVTAPDGTPLAPDTAASWREWQRMAAVLTDDALTEGRVAMWVLAPPAQTNGYYGPIEDRIPIANDIYRAVVSCRPGAGFVDWRVIAGPDGGFVWDLPDSSGHMVQVRHPDGLHFTPEGQAVLADVTVRAVQAQWAAVGGVHEPAPTCGE